MIRTRASRVAAVVVVVCVALMPGCGGGGPGAGNNIVLPVYAPVIPLTAQEVNIIIQRAAQAVDSPNMTVAVVDRVGRLLGLWTRNPATSTDDLNIAVSVARTGAFMSSSQGPITSTTLEYISTYHFPPLFGAPTRNPIPFNNFTLDTSLASQRQTLDVQGTPQGPLWQIFSSNRGAPFAGQDLDDVGQQTTPPTLFVPGNEIPIPNRIDANGNALPGFPGAGLTYLAGGIPAAKIGNVAAAGINPANCFPAGTDICARIAGAVGVYITDPVSGEPQPATAEFAAIEGLRGLGGFGVSANDITAQGGNPLTDLNLLFPFSIVPPQGRIFLVSQLLPFVRTVNRPAGVNPGPPFAGNGVQLLAGQPGGNQAFGWIIGPTADPDNPNGLTQQDVTDLVNNGIATANRTRAAIRLPAGSATKMIFAVTNQFGRILGAFRMEDAPIFSYDVSITKARCITYLSSYPGGTPSMDPADAALLNQAGIPTGVPGSPGEFGVALTTRTLAFLTQPFFPPGIDGSTIRPGPLFPLAQLTADPTQFNRMANAPPSPGLQSGIIFFPGSAPLYKNGVLVGGYGVSGDGVEEDDFVTNGGYVGFEPDQARRVDQFFFQGVRLPYFKFPNQPGGTGN